MTSSITTPATSPDDRVPPEDQPNSIVEEQVPDLARFHEEVRALLAAADETVNEKISELRGGVATMLATHRRAADRLVTDGPPGVDQWKSLREYRARVREEVIDPCHELLVRLQVDRAVSAAARETLQFLQAKPHELPESLDLAGLTSIYQVATGDSLARRSRKQFERIKRRARRLGRSINRILVKLTGRDGSTIGDRRTVALRRLADFHLQVRIGREVEKAHAHAQVQIARVVAGLEEALTRWSLDQLKFEHRTDVAKYHRPSVAVFSEPTPENGEATDEDAPLDPVVDGVKELSDSLNEVATNLAEVELSLTAHHQDTVDTFDRDIQIAGTFLLPGRSRRLPNPSRLPAVRISALGSRWQKWHTDAGGRLFALTHLIQVRDNLIEIEDGLLQRLAAATLKPVFDAFGKIKKTLQDAIEETSRACDAAGQRDDVDYLAGQLRDIQTRTLGLLRKTLREVPGVVSAHEVLNQPGQLEWDRILEMIETLPGKIPVHRLRDESDDPVEYDVAGYTMNLREIARDAIDPPLPVQLAKATRPLSQRIVQVWEETSKVEDIIKFNLDATFDELTGAAESDSETRNTSPIERARELALDALRRSVDSLDDLSESLGDPWFTLEDAVFETFQDDWSDVQRRVGSEGAVEERWVGIQTRVSREGERLWAAVRARVASVYQRVTRWLKVGIRSVRQLIARGQAAVGVSEVKDDESTRTLDAIVDLGRLQSKLPLVYRKLFSFEPVSELSLFEGRTRDLVRIRRHFERWQERHDAGVLVVSSALGGGRTSFLNAAHEKVLSQARVTYVSLDKRVKDATEFAGLVAKALDVPLSESDGLDQLQDRLLSAGRGDQPVVCLLDNIEHLILQGVGGTELMEDVLMFLSRTDAAVYWVTTVASEAWYFVEKTARSAAGFVTHYPLTPIDRGTIEEIVLNRHRRSGIPISFQEPKNPSPLLKQRLKRARTPQRKQEILRKDYFDGLHTATDQNLKLAFFYWIRTADFGAQSDELCVAWFEPLSFRFLDHLDPTRSFTLKAFIVHNTMTLEEHASIFRLPAEESAFILESLLNQRLIEPVGSSDVKHIDVAGVQAGQPYRIRRLILEPVLKHLRNKHFVY